MVLLQFVGLILLVAACFGLLLSSHWGIYLVNALICAGLAILYGWGLELTKINHIFAGAFSVAACVHLIKSIMQLVKQKTVNR